MNIHGPTSPPGIPAALFVLGLCLGSFLNVVIHRLPRGESVVRPRSRCPRCRVPLKARDNIPIVSYLILRGRCRSCGAPISFRYPLVEAISGCCLLLAWSSSIGALDAAVRAAFLLAMVTITFIDLDHQIIPDVITLPGIVVGLLAGPWIGVTRFESAIGILVGGGALLLAATVYRAARGLPGMGMGDIKLGGLLGSFLGWRGSLLSLLVGSFLGSIVGLGLIVSRRASGKTALPFGSFLAPAGIIALLFGPKLWEWYLGFLHPVGVISR